MREFAHGRGADQLRDRAGARRNAAKAGIRNGDVVLSVDGKDDFRDQMHFHAWFRLTKKAGETAEVLISRKGKRQVVKLPVVE